MNSMEDRLIIFLDNPDIRMRESRGGIRLDKLHDFIKSEINVAHSSGRRDGLKENEDFITGLQVAIEGQQKMIKALLGDKDLT